jgi:hypothetical protein
MPRWTSVSRNALASQPSVLVTLTQQLKAAVPVRVERGNVSSACVNCVTRAGPGVSHSDRLLPERRSTFSKRKQNRLLYRAFVRGATGLEPATFGVTGLFHVYDDWRRWTSYRSIHARLGAPTSNLWMMDRVDFGRLLPFCCPDVRRNPAVADPCLGRRDTVGGAVAVTAATASSCSSVGVCDLRLGVSEICEHLSRSMGTGEHDEPRGLDRGPSITRAG